MDITSPGHTPMRHLLASKTLLPQGVRSRMWLTQNWIYSSLGNNLNWGVLGLSLLLKLRKTSKSQLLLNGFCFRFFKYLFGAGS